MQTFKTIIIDDEENSRSNTKSMLASYCPELQVIAEPIPNEDELIKLVQKMLGTPINITITYVDSFPNYKFEEFICLI